MKNLTLVVLGISALVTPIAFANSSSDLARVSALANKVISGTDVKKEVSVYDNTENNPCAEPGITYIVKVSVRKSVLKELPNGEIGQEREWENFNQYYISARDLKAGRGLSDTLCQE